MEEVRNLRTKRHKKGVTTACATRSQKNSTCNGVQISMRSGGSMKLENRDAILGRTSRSWKRDSNFDFGRSGMGFSPPFEAKLWLTIKQYDLKESFAPSPKRKTTVSRNAPHRILIISSKRNQNEQQLSQKSSRSRRPVANFQLPQREPSRGRPSPLVGRITVPPRLPKRQSGDCTSIAAHDSPTDLLTPTPALCPLQLRRQLQPMLLRR